MRHNTSLVEACHENEEAGNERKHVPMDAADKGPRFLPVSYKHEQRGGHPRGKGRRPKLILKGGCEQKSGGCKSNTVGRIPSPVRQGRNFNARCNLAFELVAIEPPKRGVSRRNCKHRRQRELSKPREKRRHMIVVNNKIGRV